MTIAEKMAEEWCKDVPGRMIEYDDVSTLLAEIIERGREEACKASDHYLRGTYHRAGTRSAIESHKWEEEEV